MVDVEDYSTKDIIDQLAAQRGLAEVLDTAAEAAGLQRLTWERQDSGDGELAVLPEGESQSAAVGRFPFTLDAALRTLHRTDDLLLRVRLAIHYGRVEPAAKGFAGNGPCDVARLVDAPAVRAALASVPAARIVLVLSPALFRDVIEQGRLDVHPEHFLEVPVPRNATTAWLMIPGKAPGRIPIGAEHKVVRQSAESSGSTVTQAGRDSYVNEFRSTIHADTFHIGPKHG